MEVPSNAHSELQHVEEQIEQLQSAAGDNQEALKQLEGLQERVEALRRQISGKLTPWERTELARHPMRPYPLDYVERIFPDFSEIHGDRNFGDDPAMVCGMARFHGREVAVLGTQKGRDTKQRVYRNFGQPNPEGYRKALRFMKFAEKWERPVIALIDIVGAYPGLGAEERGQAEAIAHNLREMARLRVPFIAAITGEGGSGGALAIAVADCVLMQENSIYSVISPEGCASIMWRDSAKKDIAAAALRITAKDNFEMGFCDEVIPEPPGGAHHDYDTAAVALAEALDRHLGELEKMSTQDMLDARYKKFRNMAQYYETV
ncbi:MAG TPA: acetyl-CoA carboxylase carboxyltransferase subunit alpha [Candidatus Limnocylindrales bacterium]|jgi:acetyl-CoA carboxylase carboxyl transferase subunit alpha|nr:acetyl-CoA carboxylase carboxyltransferase subunit alpha [Candidatus Limnocylindrales bacterium]